MSGLKQRLMYLLIIFFQCYSNSATALIEVDSLQTVPCANKPHCHNGINLRMWFKNSTVENTATGKGTTTGSFVAGEEWTDSFGTWQLTESLDIQISYDDTALEYHLIDQGEFPIWMEYECPSCKCDKPCFITCNDTTQPRGRALDKKSTGRKYAVQQVEIYEAAVTIRSPAINLIWNDANNVENSMWAADYELYLDPIFDTTGCYKDLQNLYYVVEENNDEILYWTSKEYWQDAINNFNMTLETYQRDYDCDRMWGYLNSWHTVIPYFSNASEYRKYTSKHEVNEWEQNQMYMWTEEECSYIKNRYFFEINNCTDFTTYADVWDSNTKKKMPVDNLYKVEKDKMIDKFQLILDVDYRLFAEKRPTPEPTPEPSPSPTTASPTSLDPTESPTMAPVVAPTRAPSKLPTICIDNPYEYYEIAAEIEITTTSIINISSPMVLRNITEILASALDVGPEYTRLDFAEYTSSVSRRRLQSNTDTLLVRFTIFASTEDKQTRLKDKLEETYTYYKLDSALSDKFPEIIFTFLSGVMDSCEVGTKSMTVARETRCESICAVNHYYDVDSSSCKEQVEFSTITIIKINYLFRVLFFVIGIIAWIATLGLGYYGYKQYNNKSEPGSNDELSDPEENFSATRDGDSDLEESDYSPDGSSANESANESVNESLNESEIESTNESTNELSNESVTDSTATSSS